MASKRKEELREIAKKHNITFDEKVKYMKGYTDKKKSIAKEISIDEFYIEVFGKGSKLEIST